MHGCGMGNQADSGLVRIRPDHVAMSQRLELSRSLPKRKSWSIRQPSLESTVFPKSCWVVMTKLTNRRLLQIAISLAALNAILGGGFYVLLGLKGLSLTGTSLSIDQTGASWRAIDYLFRAMAGIWLVLGLMFAYMVPSIEKHTAWFRFACLAIFAMGTGRLLSISSLGSGSNPVFAMVLEFVLPPLLVLWQARVAKER